VRHHLVSNIRGRCVENRDGQYVGRLEDLIIDVNSGEVRLAVISFGSWFGLGKKSRAVPSALISTSTAKRGVIALDSGRRRWDHAPLFKSSDLQKLRQDPQAEEALARYYARSSTAQRPKEPAGVVSPDQSRMTVYSQPRNLQFATQVLKSIVVDRHGERLGKICDLLPDLQGVRPTLAILAVAKPLSKSQQFAVNLCALEPEQSDTFRVDAVATDFNHAPPLNDAAWQKSPQEESVVIFRVPDNDRTNVSSRKCVSFAALSHSPDSAAMWAHSAAARGLHSLSSAAGDRNLLQMQ
jgi:sporulation protein YlmC with PRC-barrel domain